MRPADGSPSITILSRSPTRPRTYADPPRSKLERLKKSLIRCITPDQRHMKPNTNVAIRPWPAVSASGLHSQRSSRGGAAVTRVASTTNGPHTSLGSTRSFFSDVVILNSVLLPTELTIASMTPATWSRSPARPPDAVTCTQAQYQHGSS